MDVVIKEFSCCVILRRIGSIKKERKGKRKEGRRHTDDVVGADTTSGDDVWAFTVLLSALNNKMEERNECT